MLGGLPLPILGALEVCRVLGGLPLPMLVRVARLPML